MSLIPPAEKLIAIIEGDPALLKEFQEGWINLSVRDYLEQYADIEDIVDRLAGDLGIDVALLGMRPDFYLD